MRRAAIASIFVVSFVSVLFAQNPEQARVKMVVQFTRAMKAEKARNTVEFAVSDDKEYIVDVSATGFKPAIKITRGNGQVVSTGRRIGAGHIRADLVGVPGGTLQLVVSGEEAYSRGMYTATVYEVVKKK